MTLLTDAAKAAPMAPLQAGIPDRKHLGVKSAGRSTKVGEQTHTSRSVRLSDHAVNVARSGFRQALTDGETRQFHAVVDVQLGHEPGAVAVYGGDADMHMRGDLLLGQTARDVT